MLTVLNRSTAHADATLISYTLTCSSLTVTGTTDNLYLGLDVQIGLAGLPLNFNGFPAGPGGMTTGTLTFPEQAAGTLLTILIYSSPDSSGIAGTYDGSPGIVTLTVPCVGGASTAPF